MRCICDFCSDPHVNWRYPADSFVAYVLDGIAGESVGAWAACDVCHGLIENGDRPGLAAHSIDTLIKMNPEFQVAREELSREMGRLHDSFLSSRTGAPINLVAQSRV